MHNFQTLPFFEIALVLVRPDHVASSIGKRFVVRADEKLMAFLELESAVRQQQRAEDRGGRI